MSQDAVGQHARCPVPREQGAHDTGNAPRLGLRRERRRERPRPFAGIGAPYWMENRWALGHRPPRGRDLKGAERESGHEKGSPDCGPSGRRIDARWNNIDPTGAHPVAP